MEMNRESRAGIFFVGAIVCLLVLIAIIFIASRSSGLHYIVAFDAGKGVKVGDRVQMNGIDIGEVDEVRFEDETSRRVLVRLKIAPEHRHRVMADSTAYIANSTMPNVSGQKIVEVANSPDATVPMSDGTMIEGKDSYVEYQAWRLRGKIEEWGREIQSAAQEIGKGIEEASKTPPSEPGNEPVPEEEEVKEGESSEPVEPDAMVEKKEFVEPEDVGQITDKLTEFLKTLPERAKQGMDVVMREWTELKKNLAPAMERLRELGKTLVADNLKKLMDEIERQIEALRRGQEQAPPEENEPITI